MMNKLIFKENISLRRKWKNLVKKAIGKANEFEIRESLKLYKKVDNNITEQQKSLNARSISPA